MKRDNPYLLFNENKIFLWIFFIPLLILSFIYWVVICALKFAYSKSILPVYRPKCKVISIGNITLGGTGKTPLVEWIFGYLNKNENKIGVIIRGYKRPKHKKLGNGVKNNDYLKFGDEASMFKESLGNINIYVGRDKIKSAQQLEKDGCGLAILDDGFQHWRIKRDLDIVTVDSSMMLSSQKLLPLGYLREPLSSLKRADIFVITKTDLSKGNTQKIKEALAMVNPRAVIAGSVYQPVCFINSRNNESIAIDSHILTAKPVFALSAIANPAYFTQMLLKLNLRAAKEFNYPDHYEFKKKDLEFISKSAKDMAVNTIITTHKDAVKLRHITNYLENINVFYLKIKLKITENEENFSNRLLSVLVG